MDKHGVPDTIDWKILRELQREGRVTNVELADRVGLSPPPTLRRVQPLGNLYLKQALLKPPKDILLVSQQSRP